MEQKKKEKKTSAKQKSDELEQLQQQKQELLEKLQRISADYTNYQKRTPKHIADTIAYEKERIIKSLLPCLDNFDHTLTNAHSAENADVLIDGIKIVYDQMLNILKGHGIEQIETEGAKFNPAQHQAMMQRYDEEKEDNDILEEFQKGYKLNGRVIRPSKVIVNKPPTPSETESEKTDNDTEQ